MSPISLHLTQTLVFLIIGVSIGLMLFRPKRVTEVFWNSGGSLRLIAFGLVLVRLAGNAVAQGLDVYGMMLLSELANDSGVLEWLSSRTLKLAHGSAQNLFTLVYLSGMDLVTAVLLTASAFGKELGQPTCLAVLVVTGVVYCKAKKSLFVSPMA